jgi:hypothetical protein
MNLKQTVITTISGYCIGASVILRRVTSVELLKDKRGDTVVHLHSILVEECIQLLNVNGVNDVRQTD